MAPFNLRRMSSSKSLRRRASTPPPLPPTPPLSTLSSFDYNNPPSGVLDAASSSEALEGASNAASGSVRDLGDGKERSMGKKEGAGGGIGGFFRRARSASRSGKKDGERERRGESTPPVPTLPVDLVGGDGNGLKDALPILRRGTDGGYGHYDASNVVEITSKPPKEDLASLLHFVQAAGDKFTSSSYPDWTSSSSEHATTPSLSPSTTFSSLSSPPSSSGFASPSLSAIETSAINIPKPLYSFLSHLSPLPPLTPPTSPDTYTHARRYLQPAPSESSSEDEYGSESEDAELCKIISRRIDEAPMAMRHSIVRVTSRMSWKDVELRNRTSLGRGGKRLLGLSQRRLADGQVEGARPRSNATVAIRGESLRVVVGRMGVVRKLERGVSMMEGIELERHTEDRCGQASSTSSDAEVEVGERWKGALGSFEATTTVDAVYPPRLDQLPSPSSIRTWLGRPSFVESHLVYLDTEGTTVVDLVRSRLVTQSRSPSARLTTWAYPEGAPTMATDPPPTIGARRGSLKDLVISTTASIFPPRKTLRPGPHLLRSLSSDVVASPTEEEDLPLAARSPRPPLPSPPLRHRKMSALQRAKQATATLQAEVARLKNDAAMRREQQKVLDAEREERHRAREVQRDVERRVAEQHRRSRAMGKAWEGEEPRMRTRSSSSSPGKSRPSPRSSTLPTSGSDPLANWSSMLAVPGQGPYQYQYPMMPVGGMGFYAHPQFANSAPSLHQPHPQYFQHPPLPPLLIIQPHRTLRPSTSYASLAPPSLSPRSPSHRVPPSPQTPPHAHAFLDLPPPPFPFPAYSPRKSPSGTPTSSPGRSPNFPDSPSASPRTSHRPTGAEASGSGSASGRTMKRTQSSPQIRKTAQAFLKVEGTRIGRWEDKNVAVVQAW